MTESRHVTGGGGAAPTDAPHPRSGGSAPPKQSGKAKLTLSPDNIVKTIANVVASGPVLLAALVKPKTSAALRERVMLGVTSVTDCRYCQWGHTHWAMAHGVPVEEVNQILGHQIESLKAKNPAEAAAILFAQHYAEHLDRFDPESIANLRTHYSDAQVAEILAYVRAITLGGLTGNTVDALLDRVRCHAPTTTLFRGVVATAGAPVVRLLTLLAKFHRRASMDKTRSRWHRPHRDGQGTQRGTVDEGTSATLPLAIRLDSGGPGGCSGCRVREGLSGSHTTSIEEEA